MPEKNYLSIKNRPQNGLGEGLFHKLLSNLLFHNITYIFSRKSFEFNSRILQHSKNFKRILFLFSTKLTSSL
jgi:hypothetical protein